MSAKLELEGQKTGRLTVDGAKVNDRQSKLINIMLFPSSSQLNSTRNNLETKEEEAKGQVICRKEGSWGLIEDRLNMVR